MTHHRIEFLLGCLLSLSLAACSGETEPPDSSGDPETLTKEEARELGGKSDHGTDFCEFFGWYGDDICDDFCPEPDPDCGADEACLSDADCPNGYCEAVPASCLGTGCPPPPVPQCVFPNCDDDSQTVCAMVPPTCPDGQVSAVRGGCYECVDARTCEPPDAGGDDCGGLAGLTCADGQFCQYAADAMCGAADQLGTCVDVPQVCPAVIDPVCGCDGNTYQNACQAASSGVSVASQGACAAGNQCGGIAGTQCPADQWCEFDEGTCGEFDLTGSCRPFSEFCTQQYDPVCGCNGQTYSNQCFASAAGASIRHRGECDDDQSTTCGGRAGFTCGADEYCHYDQNGGAACGTADGGGVCKTRPEACIQVYDPVCGCNGQTYSNACMARAAGVDVSSEGACN